MRTARARPSRWHLLEVLKPKVPVKRMVFHEITRSAIQHAIDESRDVDYGLVDAQESRRIVDRLYGYPVSEVCWRKIRQGLSAGRVQSPSVRLVVERERERMAFVAASYWDLSRRVPHRAGVHRVARHRSTAHRVGGQPRLRRQGPAPGATTSPCSTRRRPGSSGTASTASRSGRQRRDQALHLAAQAAVHHLHPPAGGRLPAAHEQPPGDERSPRASTRTATSPTCGPTARRCRRPPRRPPAR